MVQLSHPYMTTEKNVALTIWTFVSKVISLLFNMLSRFAMRGFPDSLVGKESACNAGDPGLISLQIWGLSRVFSSTTIQKLKFFGTQLSSWSNLTSIHDYWKNYSFDYTDLCWQSDISAF